MRTKHPFNLIEISIALGVIAIGVVAVVGVFPMAAAKTRDAMTETYAANAATDLLGYIEFQGGQSWDWSFLPASRPAAGTTRNGTAIAGTNGTIYKNKTSEVGAYHILSYTDANGDGQYDKATDGEPDFEAEMLVWQSTVSSSIPASVAVRLNVEVSWPAAADFANRQKAFYTTELFKR